MDNNVFLFREVLFADLGTNDHPVEGEQQEAEGEEVPGVHNSSRLRICCVHYFFFLRPLETGSSKSRYRKLSSGRNIQV